MAILAAGGNPATSLLPDWQVRGELGRMLESCPTDTSTDSILPRYYWTCKMTTSPL